MPHETSREPGELSDGEPERPPSDRHGRTSPEPMWTDLEPMCVGRTRKKARAAERSRRKRSRSREGGDGRSRSPESGDGGGPASDWAREVGFSAS